MERIRCRDGILRDWDLHPRRRQDRCLSIVIGVSISLKWLSAVHCFRWYSDPSLILGDHGYHACLVNVSELDLIPWILHEPKVIRYLSFILTFLDGVFGEDLIGFLKVFMFIARSLQYFFCYKPASSDPQSIRSVKVDTLTAALVELFSSWNDGCSLDVVMSSLVPAGLNVLLFVNQTIELNAVHWHVENCLIVENTCSSRAKRLSLPKIYPSLCSDSTTDA